MADHPVTTQKVPGQIPGQTPGQAAPVAPPVVPGEAGRAQEVPK
jgi:hypothetical protein